MHELKTFSIAVTIQQQLGTLMHNCIVFFTSE